VSKTRHSKASTSSFVSCSAISKDRENTYQYELLVEEGAIRLLELKPAQDLQAKLECSMVHKTLSECDDDLAGHYTALSYVWGDPMKVKSISIE